MSFDAFEARLQFLQLLRKLNASAQSIQKVVSYAVKYGSRCGEDLWEVVMEECAKGTLNTRINVLYFLDSLLDVSMSLGPPDAPYMAFVAKDLGEIVHRVVPDNREGVLNLRSAKQILESWRTRRVIDPAIIDQVLHSLANRSFDSEGAKKRGHAEAFSRNDILRRMEEDRERHKRLRERIWILPIPSLVPSKPPVPTSSTSSNPSPSPASPFTPASPSSRPAPTKAPTPGSSLNPAQLAPGVAAGATAQAGGKMLPPPKPAAGTKNVLGEVGLNALEMEFEQTWEGAMDLSQDDFERMRLDALAAGLTVPFIS